MNGVVQFFKTLFQTVEAIALAALEHGAVVAAPLCPAFFFGYAIYTAVAELTLWQLAAVVGVSAAFALEAVGIKSFHNALRLGTAVSYLPPALYMTIGIGTLVVIEGDNSAGIVGVAMFLLTAVLYLTMSIDRRADQRHIETADDLARQRHIEDRQAEQQANAQERQAERDHRLKLAEIAAQRDVAMARNVPHVSHHVPTNVPPANKADWRTLSRAERTNMHHLSVADIVERYAIGERAARNWIARSRKLAQNGHLN